ncbi:MAG: MmcQ/YjbR family DNA-binding protein, partial [Lachnospiraceae bacterium]|nr:MmcQ/YjbR family DNA-binding protein [Lachnospiraceae bacterium]
SRRWYGLLMPVRRCRLTGEKAANPEDSPLMEILNLKIGADGIQEVLKMPGVYPSYHMKHTNWISVLLDGTVPDEKIMEWIDQSRSFAVQAGKKPRSGPISWIVPSNPKYFDIFSAFAESDEILWKQGKGIARGDTVYMYVAAPVSAICFQCTVTEVMIPYEYKDEDVSMTHAMKIRLLKSYPPEMFSWERLKSIGIKAIRGPLPAPEAFLRLV